MPNRRIGFLNTRESNLRERPRTPYRHNPQVVARYGYMDIVDHGPGFVESIVDYIA